VKCKQTTKEKKLTVLDEDIQHVIDLVQSLAEFTNGSQPSFFIGFFEAEKLVITLNLDLTTAKGLVLSSIIMITPL